MLYGDVPCPAVLFRASLSFFRTYSSTGYHAIPGTDRLAMYIRVYSSFFSLSSFHCPFSILAQSFFHPKNFTHGSERGIANKHTQHSTGHSALRIKQPFALSNRKMHQIMGLFCRLHVYLCSSLRESSGRRQPPAERSPCTYYILLELVGYLETHWFFSWLL